MNSKPKYSIQALVSAPITSRAIRNSEHADHRSPEADEAAADQRHHHDVAGLMQAHHVGEGRKLRHREQAAGQAPTTAADSVKIDAL